MPTPQVKKSHAKRNLAVVLILIVIVGTLGVGLFRPGPVPDTARSPKPIQTGAPVISDEKVNAAASYALDWFSESHSRNEHFAVRDEVYKATAIFWYVYSRITYDQESAGTEHFQSPSETLKLGKGDCDDQAILMAAMCESVGLDAAVEFVDTDQDGKVNHALCSVYYGGSSKGFISRQQAIWEAFGAYPEHHQIAFWNEPRTIYVRDEEHWAAQSKYPRGIWATLEEWKYCTSMKAYDVDYALLTSAEGFREFVETVKHDLNLFPG